jgi:hypothetical protein
MITTKVISQLAAFALWIPLIFFSLLLTHNAMLYFTHGGEYGILPEKLIARLDPLWNLAFYIHLPTGVLCLLTPVFLLSKAYFKNLHQLHQLIGKIYVWVTLLVVCPTGMYLALYAKGGIITQVGFMIQGILLGVFTYKGYRATLNGNKSEHVANMIRSYAVGTVVLTFRILHILFFLLKVPYVDNYAMSQWLGLSVNLLFAELLLAFRNTHKKTITIKSQQL